MGNPILMFIAPMAGLLILMSIGFTFCLRAHHALRLRMTKMAETARQETSEQELRLQAAELALAKMQSHIRELEDQTQLSSGNLAKSWTNINRRTQALRMLRGGERADRVATELAMSRGEVELIQKVHGIVSKSYENVAEITPMDHSISSISG